MAHDFSLPIATDELIAEVDGSSAVSSELTLDDLDNWEQHFIPENDPENWGLRRERQTRNDCQGNALTTCMEVIEHRTKQKRAELSRMFAYQQSERVDGWLGRDRGSTIQAGVKVARTLGCPTEAEYPYHRYTRSEHQLQEWTRQVADSAKSRAIFASVVAPAWEQMIAYVIHGNPVHWGTYWPLQWNRERVVSRYAGAHGRGGHATAIVWAKRLSSGEMLAKVANSHGDGYFWVNQRAYTEMIDRRHSPFGAYVLQGEKEPFERHVFV